MPENKSVAPSRLKAIWQAAFGRRAVQDGIEPVPPMISASGNTVTPGAALEVAAVWSCVRLLSETIATMPLMLYRTDRAGTRNLATDHGLYALLHDAPSYDFTAVEFWEGVALGLCLRGNAYARKEMIGNRLVALTPLRSDLMVVDRNQAGERVYRYSDPKGQKVYREAEIFHVRGFGGAGDIGLSVVEFARQSIGQALAGDSFAGSLFRNGVRPSTILTVDQTLTPEQRQQVRENIVEPFMGADQAGGVMVLEAGFTMQPMTMTMLDAQFIENRGFTVEEICRWFRVPPWMIGHTSGSSNWGTGLEQQLLAFLTFSLRPYLARIEQAISRSLLSPVDRLTLKPEFKVEGLLRTDSAARAGFYTVMVQNGVMTRNEVRRLENLPPLPGGDELTVQSQNVPLGQQPAPPQKTGDGK